MQRTDPYPQGTEGQAMACGNGAGAGGHNLARK